MNIECETDKRVNVYALWSGDQIVLGKKIKSGTLINGENWIVLWPTKSGESQMLKCKLPEKDTDFLLSDKGRNYLKKIYHENRKNTYIAKVEYYPIDGINPSLWKDLFNLGEFVLWDIPFGPVRLFENSPFQNMLAIYRVYEINYEITENDLGKDILGRLKRRNEVNEEASQKILKVLKYAKPILSDKEFEGKKKEILKIWNWYQNILPFLF